MSAFNPEDLTAPAVIAGQLEVVKKFIPEKLMKLLPLVAIGLGIAYVYSVKPGSVANTLQAVALGFTLGISAVGLYEGTMHSMEFMKNLRKPKV